MKDRKRTAKLSISVYPEERDMFKMYAQRFNTSISEIMRDALNVWLNCYRNCTDKEDYEYWKYRFKV